MNEVIIIDGRVSGLSTASLLVKEPGMVWKQKMPHQVDGVKGLFFVGDSTISYGIGINSAAHSSILCHPKIMKYLNTESQNVEMIMRRNKKWI